MQKNRKVTSERDIETYRLPSDKAKKRRKKKRGWKKRLLIGLTIFLAVIFLAICSGVYVIFYYINMIDIVDDPAYTEILDGPDEDVDSNLQNSPQEEIDQLENEVQANSGGDVMSSKQVINILLIGTDGRSASERGRSDSMILISINKVTGKLFMTSFLRDSYVDIPGVDSNNRLNSAYSKGGAALLMDTIEANYKIQVDQYVQVNFESFKDTIDLLGGVEMTVTNGEAGEIPGISSGGTYTLNGEQALAYARIRHVGNGDFGRAERQRKVLNVLVQKCKGLSVSELNALLDQLLPNITTNIPGTEIAKHVLSAPTYLSYSIIQQQVPCDDSWSFMTVRHMSVLRVDFQKNIELIKNTIYEGIY